MNRRNFLGGLITTTAGLYFAPLKVYSFPSSRFLSEQNVLRIMKEKALIYPDPTIPAFQLQLMKEFTWPQLKRLESYIARPDVSKQLYDSCGGSYVYALGTNELYFVTDVGTFTHGEA